MTAKLSEEANRAGTELIMYLLSHKRELTKHDAHLRELIEVVEKIIYSPEEAS